MKQTCYRLEKEKYLSVIPCADLPAQPTEGDGDYWQEIETASPDELAEWIKPLELHPLMVEDILTAEHSTLIDRYGQQAVYIEFPTNLDEGDVGVAYLSIILRPHQIATIRRGQITAMQGLVDRFQHEIRPHRARTTMVLYYILDHFIDQDMLLALNLRNRIDSLEQTFADDPAAIELSEITKLKRETTALISVADDQRYCVKALESMHFEALDFSEYKTYLRDITSNAEQVLRVLRPVGGKTQGPANQLPASGEQYQREATARADGRLGHISAFNLDHRLFRHEFRGHDPVGPALWHLAGDLGDGCHLAGADGVFLPSRMVQMKQGTSMLARYVPILGWLLGGSDAGMRPVMVMLVAILGLILLMVVGGEMGKRQTTAAAKSSNGGRTAPAGDAS